MSEVNVKQVINYPFILESDNLFNTKGTLYLIDKNNKKLKIDV